MSKAAGKLQARAGGGLEAEVTAQQGHVKQVRGTHCLQGEENAHGAEDGRWGQLGTPSPARPRARWDRGGRSEAPGAVSFVHLLRSDTALSRETLGVRMGQPPSGVRRGWVGPVRWPLPCGDVRFPRATSAVPSFLPLALLPRS